MNPKRLWVGFAAVVTASFAVLGYFGWEIYRAAPPIPDRVVSANGETLLTGDDISNGQNVWQSIGGQEVGTVWGHGSYVAPDRSANYLHRESSCLLDHWAQQDNGSDFADASPEVQAALKARLREELRTNTYDPASGTLTVSDDRARAMQAVAAHYAGLFGTAPELKDLREAYALPPPNTNKTPERQIQMAAFFFWAAWACSTNRPGQAVTYTNNWPSRRLPSRTCADARRSGHEPWEPMRSVASEDARFAVPGNLRLELPLMQWPLVEDKHHDQHQHQGHRWQHRSQAACSGSCVRTV